VTTPAVSTPTPLRSFGHLLYFGGLAGAAFGSIWWLGSPRAMGWALAGGAGAIPLAWLLGRLLPGRSTLSLALGVLLVHLLGGVAGALGGLPWVEVLKFVLQGTFLGLLAGARVGWGRVPVGLGIAAVAVPLVLALLARQQVALEFEEGIRLQEVLAASIATGTAFPDSGEVGSGARVWVVDRGTARIVASPTGAAGELADLGLEHPGRMLTEAGGAYATRLTRHAVVAWRAVPGRSDVGVVIIIYEPTSDFDAPLGWALLTLVTVVGAGVVIARNA
jgi:hypothetical protein